MVAEVKVTSYWWDTLYYTGGTCAAVVWLSTRKREGKKTSSFYAFP